MQSIGSQRFGHHWSDLAHMHISNYNFKYFFCFFLSLSFFFWYPNYTYIAPFVVVQEFLDLHFFFLLHLLFAFIFAFQFWKFLLRFSCWDCFLHHFQSTDKFVKVTLHFYNAFLICILFGSILEFPFLWLHYPYVLTFSLLYPLSP